MQFLCSRMNQYLLSVPPRKRMDLVDVPISEWKLGPRKAGKYSGWSEEEMKAEKLRLIEVRLHMYCIRIMCVCTQNTMICPCWNVAVTTATFHLANMYPCALPARVCLAYTQNGEYYPDADNEPEQARDLQLRWQMRGPIDAKHFKNQRARRCADVLSPDFGQVTRYADHGGLPKKAKRIWQESGRDPYFKLNNPNGAPCMHTPHHRPLSRALNNFHAYTICSWLCNSQ